MSLFRWLLALARRNPGQAVVWVIRPIAEGTVPLIGDRANAWLKSGYWWLAGKKTYIGLSFGAAYFVLDQLCRATASEGLVLPFDSCKVLGWLGTAAVMLIAAGFLDATYRAQPPSK